MRSHERKGPEVEKAEVVDMISEGSPTDPPESARERAKRRWPGRSVAPEPGFHTTEAPESTEHGRQSWFARKLDRFSENIGRRYLEILGRGGRLSDTVRGVPKRMRKVANQTQLVVELIDDVRDGTYRDLPWRSVAIMSAGLLYSVSPADVIPELVPFFGAVDDMVVMALATRWVERDLRAYCRFKGYNEGAYF